MEHAVLPSLEKWHKKLLQNRWLRGGLLAFILIIFSGGVAAMGLKWFEPPALSKLLPAEQTMGYIETDRHQLKSIFEQNPHEELKNIYESLTFLPDPFDLKFPTPFEELPDWVGAKTGIAWLEKRPDRAPENIIFGAVGTGSDRSHDLSMESELEQLRTAGWQVDRISDYVVITQNPETIDLLRQVQNGDVPALHRDSNFMALRPNLMYDAPMFAYLNTAKIKNMIPIEEVDRTLLFFNEKNLWDTLKSVSPFFPAIGFTLNASSDSTTEGIVLQTHWLGDKSMNNDEALFHLDQKYRGDLAHYFPENLTTFIGGQQGGVVLEQLFALLETTEKQNPSRLETQFLEHLIEYAGQDATLEENLYPLLQKEFAIGISKNSAQTVIENSSQIQASMEPAPQHQDPIQTPALDQSSQNLLFAFEMDDNGMQKFETLKANLLTRGLFKHDVENQKLFHIALKSFMKQEGEIQYETIVTEEGKNWIHILQYKNIVFITQQESDMKKVIQVLSKKEKSYAETGNQQNLKTLISSADFVVVHDGNSEDPKIFSGFNVFDDGIRTQHLIQLKNDQ